MKDCPSRKRTELLASNGRDEMNFCEWPLGCLSNRQLTTDLQQLTFKDCVPHPKTSQPVLPGLDSADASRTEDTL